jgi:hypothetical protein
MYRHVRARPPKVPRSEEEEEEYKVAQLRKEREVSEAFLSYLCSKGAFEDWEKNKKSFQTVHVSGLRHGKYSNAHDLKPKGTNPLAMWKAFLTTPTVRELADFALLVLGISVNQAALECNFSDLKIKKTRLRNRMKLPRLEKMAKVRISIEKLTVCISNLSLPGWRRHSLFANGNRIYQGARQKKKSR